MASNWHQFKLGELTDWASGGTPPKNNPMYWGGDIPWISASSMKTGRLVDSERTLTVKGLENGSRLAKKGAVLLLVRGSELHKRIPVGLAMRDMAFNQDVKALSARNGLDPVFLYYWLSGSEVSLLAKVEHTGIGAGKLDTKVLKNLKVDLPPISHQQAIIRVLSTLDDKIELNRRISETLEAMARALFKSWFVDFDPVRAKMEGRWKRGQSLPGLPAHLYGLFPERLVDSELGEIPEGWEVGCVGNAFELTMGQSPPGDTYNEAGNGLPFYQGRTDFGFRFPTRRVYCTAPTRLASAGDTLISVRAPVGDINMASEACAIGRGVAAARHRSGSRSYTFQFMRGLEEVFGRFEAEGTVFGSIGKKDFHAIPTAIPPGAVISTFERLCSAIDSRIETDERESRTLVALRDALLPKLISGELRMKNAEKFLGGVAV